MGEIDQSQMPRTSQITLITLYGALFPLALALLPVATLIAVPRLPSSSPSSSGDDARLADIYVSWVPGDDGTDAADTSGWRARVQAALARVKDLGELVEWLTEACNSVTRDMSVEILSLEDLAACTFGTRPASLATWLDALSWGLLGEHCALLAEVEGLGLSLALA